MDTRSISAQKIKALLPAVLTGRAEPASTQFLAQVNEYPECAPVCFELIRESDLDSTFWALSCLLHRVERLGQNSEQNFLELASISEQVSSLVTNEIFKSSSSLRQLFTERSFLSAKLAVLLADLCCVPNLSVNVCWLGHFVSLCSGYLRQFSSGSGVSPESHFISCTLLEFTTLLLRERKGNIWSQKKVSVACRSALIKSLEEHSAVLTDFMILYSMSQSERPVTLSSVKMLEFASNLVDLFQESGHQQFFQADLLRFFSVVATKFFESGVDADQLSSLSVFLSTIYKQLVAKGKKCLASQLGASVVLEYCEAGANLLQRILLHSHPYLSLFSQAPNPDTISSALLLDPHLQECVEHLTSFVSSLLSVQLQFIVTPHLASTPSSRNSLALSLATLAALLLLHPSLTLANSGLLLVTTSLPVWPVSAEVNESAGSDSYLSQFTSTLLRWLTVRSLKLGDSSLLPFTDIASMSLLKELMNPSDLIAACPRLEEIHRSLSQSGSAPCFMSLLFEYDAAVAEVDSEEKVHFAEVSLVKPFATLIAGYRSSFATMISKAVGYSCSPLAHPPSLFDTLQIQGSLSFLGSLLRAMDTLSQAVGSEAFNASVSDSSAPSMESLLASGARKVNDRHYPSFFLPSCLLDVVCNSFEIFSRVLPDQVFLSKPPDCPFNSDTTVPGAQEFDNRRYDLMRNFAVTVFNGISSLVFHQCTLLDKCVKQENQADGVVFKLTNISEPLGKLPVPWYYVELRRLQCVRSASRIFQIEHQDVLQTIPQLLLFIVQRACIVPENPAAGTVTKIAGALYEDLLYMVRKSAISGLIALAQDTHDILAPHLQLLVSILQTRVNASSDASIKERGILVECLVSLASSTGSAAVHKSSVDMLIRPTLEFFRIGMSEILQLASNPTALCETLIGSPDVQDNISQKAANNRTQLMQMLTQLDLFARRTTLPSSMNELLQGGYLVPKNQPSATALGKSCGIVGGGEGPKLLTLMKSLPVNLMPEYFPFSLLHPLRESITSELLHTLQSVTAGILNLFATDLTAINHPSATFWTNCIAGNSADDSSVPDTLYQMVIQLVKTTSSVTELLVCIFLAEGDVAAARDILDRHLSLLTPELLDRSPLSFLADVIPLVLQPARSPYDQTSELLAPKTPGGEPTVKSSRFPVASLEAVALHHTVMARTASTVLSLVRNRLKSSWETLHVVNYQIAVRSQKSPAGVIYHDPVCEKLEAMHMSAYHDLVRCENAVLDWIRDVLSNASSTNQPSLLRKLLPDYESKPGESHEDVAALLDCENWRKSSWTVIDLKQQLNAGLKFALYSSTDLSTNLTHMALKSLKCPHPSLFGGASHIVRQFVRAASGKFLLVKFGSVTSGSPAQAKNQALNAFAIFGALCGELFSSFADSALQPFAFDPTSFEQSDGPDYWKRRLHQTGEMVKTPFLTSLKLPMLPAGEVDLTSSLEDSFWNTISAAMADILYEMTKCLKWQYSLLEPNKSLSRPHWKLSECRLILSLHPSLSNVIESLMNPSRFPQPMPEESVENFVTVLLAGHDYTNRKTVKTYLQSFLLRNVEEIFIKSVSNKNSSPCSLQSDLLRYLLPAGSDIFS